MENHGNTGRRGDSVNNISSNSSSSNEATRKNASSSQCRSPPIATATWQQKMQRAPQSFSPSSCTMSIGDAPFCRLYAGSRHPTKKCAAILPQLYATTPNSLEANLDFIVRRPLCNPSNPYRSRSPQKYFSKPTTQCSVKACNSHALPQIRKHPPYTYDTRASATLPPLKYSMQRTRGL